MGQSVNVNEYHLSYKKSYNFLNQTGIGKGSSWEHFSFFYQSILLRKYLAFMFEAELFYKLEAKFLDVIRFLVEKQSRFGNKIFFHGLPLQLGKVFHYVSHPIENRTELPIYGSLLNIVIYNFVRKLVNNKNKRQPRSRLTTRRINLMMKKKEWRFSAAQDVLKLRKRVFKWRRREGLKFFASRRPPRRRWRWRWRPRQMFRRRRKKLKKRTYGQLSEPSFNFFGLKSNVKFGNIISLLHKSFFFFKLLYLKYSKNFFYRYNLNIEYITSFLKGLLPFYKNDDYYYYNYDYKMKSVYLQRVCRKFDEIYKNFYSYYDVNPFKVRSLSLFILKLNFIKNALFFEFLINKLTNKILTKLLQVRVKILRWLINYIFALNNSFRSNDNGCRYLRVHSKMVIRLFKIFSNINFMFFFRVAFLFFKSNDKHYLKFYHKNLKSIVFVKNNVSNIKPNVVKQSTKKVRLNIEAVYNLI